MSGDEAQRGLGKTEWDEAYAVGPLGGVTRTQSNEASFLPKRTRKTSRPTTCQVDGCGRELLGEKAYLQRYSVCEQHFKADVALLHGQEVRFCQQCNKFQDIREFEGVRRSCAARSKDRNLRRRLQTTLQHKGGGGGGAGEDSPAAGVSPRHQQRQQSDSPGVSGALGPGAGAGAGGAASEDSGGGGREGSRELSVAGTAAVAAGRRRGGSSAGGSGCAPLLDASALLGGGSGGGVGLLRGYASLPGAAPSRPQLPPAPGCGGEAGADPTSELELLLAAGAAGRELALQGGLPAGLLGPQRAA
ncbi:hypothetical protein Agub_g9791, partial [Astrephomene gubernaculifera]